MCLSYRTSHFSLINIIRYLLVFITLLLPFEQMAWAVDNIRVFANTVAHQTEKLSSSTASQVKTWQAYKLPVPSKFTVSPLTKLPVLANGQSAMPSNANNFHGSINATVDSRTGKASFSMPVGSVLYDQGQSKRNLLLSYSSGSSALGSDPLDLGPHWSFNVGTEYPSSSEVAGHETTSINTGDGHSMTMESDRNESGQKFWHPMYHKLNDVHITGEPGDWIIATATGAREHLLNGYEDWEENRDGKRIWFYYDRNGPTDISRHLIYICAHTLTSSQVNGVKNACAKDGIWLTYEGGDITVHAEQSLVVHTTQVDGEPIVKSVSLPSLSSKGISNGNNTANVEFGYDTQSSRPWLLHQVTEPSGKMETFLYDQESGDTTQQSQGLPTGLSNTHIPVVTKQIITPPTADKKAIPVKSVSYQYSANANDLHNYTGYQAGVSSEPGKDNLLDRADSYTYTVKQDNGFTTTSTVYNKYHLPLTITQKSDLHRAVIAQSTMNYSAWQGTSFTQLPSTYSLPNKTIKTLYSLTSNGGDEAVSPTTVVQQKQYDNNGRVIWQEDAWGRQIFTQYCPPQGDLHCPAMDPNWPQENLPEKVMKLPAQHTPMGSSSYKNFTNTEPSSVVETVYDYKSIPVSQLYKKKLLTYQHLLEQQVIEAQKNKINLDVDTSHLAGQWQVKTKTVGTLSLDAVVGFNPGEKLPELSQQEITTQTDYHYNDEQSTSSYGQLKQLTITRRAEDTPIYHVHNKLLHLVTMPLSENQAIEKVTIDINRQQDLKKHTQATTMSIAPNTSLSDVKGAMKLLKGSSNGIIGNGDDGLSLGTTTYSLVTGVKLAHDDTMQTVHEEWVYDIWNRPVREIITPTSGGKPQTVTWTYILTAQEQAVVKTTPDGNQQKIVYSGQGDNRQVLSTWHRFKNQTNCSMEGLSNWIPDSESSYTSAGKLATKTVYHATDSEDGKSGKKIGLTTRYGYDALNRPIWQQTPDGMIKILVRNDPKMWSMSYQVATSQKDRSEKLGPVLTVVQSNTLGKPVEEYKFALNPSEMLKNKPVYNSTLQQYLRALEQQLKPASSLQTTDSYGLLPLAGKNGLIGFINAVIGAKAWLNQITSSYDGNGHLISQTQPDGATTYWEWQHSNLVATITPDGSIIHDTFNLMGKKIARCVQPSGSHICHTLGERGYDSEGNLAWQEDEHGNRITYTYDADGRELSMTTPATKDAQKGHVFTYTWNSYGQTGVAIDGQLYVKYIYDPVTWHLTDREDNISHLHYSYDKSNARLVKISRSAPVFFKSPVGISYPGGMQTITYNRYNQPVRLTDMEGNTFIVQHDLLGRVLKKYVILPGKKDASLLEATTYDSYFNRPVQITNGIGITRTLAYDSLGQLSKTTDQRANVILQQLVYTYDIQTGNIITLTKNESRGSSTQTYSYDKNTNSLTKMACNVTGQPGKPSPLCPRDTDLAGSTETKPPVILSQLYSFDKWKNISSVTEQLAKGGSKTTKITRYTYATATNDPIAADHYDPHQMLTFSRQWTSSGVSEAPKVITYDKLGRVIKDVDGNTLHYNAFGQEDGFTNSHTLVHTIYTYDSLGHQIAEQPFTNKGQPLQNPLYMLYRGNTVISQFQKDSKGQSHISVEIGGIARSEDGVIAKWYLHDYKGDVIDTFDQSGKQISNHVYSPYGMDYDCLSNTTQALPAKLNVDAKSLWWQHHQSGFDNQMTDPATGYQFLGGGYRAYNPVSRHFMSHDSFSPFKKIDGYGFGDNNPIMNTDPSGHLPKWLAYTLGALSIAMAASTAVLLPVLSTVAGEMGISMAVSLICSSTTAISGSLQIAATAHPDNWGLERMNIAFGISDGITGIFQGVTTSVLGVMGIVNGLNRVSGALVITSGISGVSEKVLYSSIYGMDASVLTNPSLANGAGWKKAQETLGYLSMLLMVTSLVTGVGAGMSTEAFRGKMQRTTARSRGEGGLETGNLGNRSIKLSEFSFEQREGQNQHGSFSIDFDDEIYSGRQTAGIGSETTDHEYEVVQYRPRKFPDPVPHPPEGPRLSPAASPYQFMESEYKQGDQIAGPVEEHYQVPSNIPALGGASNDDTLIFGKMSPDSEIENNLYENVRHTQL